jgi:hypothetical protein
MSLSRAVPKQDFSDLTDTRIDTWIERFVAKRLTADPQCQLLFEERARRQSKLLSIEKSLQHLVETARVAKFTTYGALANASGVSWDRARYVMNGPRRHLDRLLEVCYARNMPLLTSLCANRRGLAAGEPSDVALDAFVNGAKRLGYEITDRKEFLRKSQRECFEWGATSLQSD